MKNKKYFLTSGEFAKMNGINKRTLHYYNDIGLFRPEMIDENGYHYYSRFQAVQLEMILIFRRLGLSIEEIRTYTDDIGLFRPEMIDENGYHYYSRFQAVQLEMILIFRRLGLSIEEIRTYTDHPSDASFTQIIKEKQELIDRSVCQLLEVKAFLQQKQEKLALGLSASHGKIERIHLPKRHILLSAPITGAYDEQEVKAFLQQKQEKLALGLSASHGKIERIHLPKRHILLSAPITGAYDEQDFSVAADFSLRLKTIFGLYDNFGSRISIQNISSGNFNDYDCFFSYGRNDAGQYDAVLPAGEYLRAFSVGSWDRLKDVYDRLLSFAQEHELTLTGFAYEEGLNEMALRELDDYITASPMRKGSTKWLCGSLTIISR